MTTLNTETKRNSDTFKMTGCEYMLIDLANAYGLDKEVFSKRIEWAKANLDNLELLIMEADEPIMFAKATMVIRAIQKGSEISHMVELDATTSGVQIMSALTGCRRGALWTNLIDPETRRDCYTEVHKEMLKLLDGIECEITRSEAKEAVMCAFYGSVAEPIKIFGEDTDELNAFYEVLSTQLPGAYELLQDFKGLWNPYALNHSWTLPDGHKTMVNVMVDKSNQIEIDELDHHRFTFNYSENEGTERGVALAAHIIHSIDAYVVREVNARCNYNKVALESALRYINKIIEVRPTNIFERNTDMVISLSTIDRDNSRAIMDNMSTNDLIRLGDLIVNTLSKSRFEIVCIHDAYKCHPNYCNELRYHYREILAELAESDLLSQIFSEISGEEEHYSQVEGGMTKVEMSTAIRNSAYALC